MKKLTLEQLTDTIAKLDVLVEGLRRKNYEAEMQVQSLLELIKVLFWHLRVSPLDMDTLKNNVKNSTPGNYSGVSAETLDSVTSTLITYHIDHIDEIREYLLSHGLDKKYAPIPPVQRY